METYDFVVLGAGSAGYAAAATGARLGLRVCCIEAGRDLGGLCILRGCMPSKTYIESANRFQTLRRAEEFGLRTGKIGFEASAIRDRKRRLIAEFAHYRVGQLQSGRFTFIRGRARFLDDTRLEVNLADGEGEPTGETVQIGLRTALIATGSRIDILPLPGLQEAGYLTSDTLLETGEVPPSVVVLGGGAIALEFAHYYEAFGSRVTVIQRSPQILRDADPDVADALARALRHRGVEIHCGTKLLGVTPGPPHAVRYEHEGRERVTRADAILYALGRRPAVDGLGLEAASVELTAQGGVRIGATAQTNRPHLFGAGDVTGTYEVVHQAVEQGVLAARNAARLLQGRSLSALDYRLKLFAIFTEPQVAYVGLNEREARAEEVPYRTASYPFADHGKALVHGEAEGFVKLLCHERTGEIVGGAVVGPAASELIHEITVAMHFGSTAAQLAAIPHYHPTLSEIWTYPAEELAEGTPGFSMD